VRCSIPWASEPTPRELHPANILAGNGRLTGVVDFGDITSGDPACDLGVVWMLVEAAQHEAFAVMSVSAVGRSTPSCFNAGHEPRPAAARDNPRRPR
jgi:hypothetical protein